MRTKFRGRYLHKLDEKGRLTIPKTYRDLLGLQFVIGKDVKANCINIYTGTALERIDMELEGKSVFDEEARETQRDLYGNSDDCTIDKQGRIAIPSWLLDMTGVTKEVWLVGSGNIIEIWDKDEYENRKQGQK